MWTVECEIQIQLNTQSLNYKDFCRLVFSNDDLIQAHKSYGLLGVLSIFYAIQFTNLEQNKTYEKGKVYILI